MQTVTTPLFSLPPMRRLLDEEWAVAVREATSLPAGNALSIAATALAARALVPGRSGTVHLHVDAGGLAGDVACEANALPWAAASFDLVIVRHATDLLAGVGLEAELARVLAPGGTLLLAGLNPLSPWRLWWSRPIRAHERLVSLAAPGMRSRLGALGLAVTRDGYLGGSWPRSESAIDIGWRKGARWHGAWMLRADKQAIAVRPRPLRVPLGMARPAPALASRGSLRQRA